MYKRQNLILLDDVPVYNPSHALGLFSVFNPTTVNNARLSVSYTHLRAHETVLDLVCRLLLEKKKNSYKQQPVLSELRLSLLHHTKE